MSKSQHVVYIKTNRYFRSYLSSMFGGEPLQIPSTHRIGQELEYGLIENRQMYELSRTTMSENQYDLIKSGTVKEIAEIPDEDEGVGQWVPIVMPKSIWLRGVEVKTNGYYQLTKRAATRIRKILKRDFFVHLFEHVRRAAISDSIDGVTPNREDAILMFMRQYGIPVGELDNISRQYKRELAATKQALEIHDEDDEENRKNGEKITIK